MINTKYISFLNVSSKLKRVMFLYFLGIPVPNPYPYLIESINNYFDIDFSKTIKKRGSFCDITEYYNHKGDFIFMYIDYDTIFKNSKETEILTDDAYKKNLLSPLSAFIRKNLHENKEKTFEINVLSMLILNRKGFKFDEFD